jgi:hypothetical protein
VGDKIKKNDLGVRRMYGGRRNVYMVLILKPRERHHLVDPGVDGSIILTFRRRNFLLNFSTSCI